MPDGPLIRRGELTSQLGLVLLDCRKGRPERLIGARIADLESDLSAPGDPSRGGRHPLPALEAFCDTLGRWGIGRDTPVVAFDDTGGGLYAARAWWMLRAVGHQRVWVLDGPAPTDLRLGGVTPREPYPAACWSWPMVEIDTVRRICQDPSWKLVDARSAARWRGEVEPIDPVPGRIQGSVNLPWEITVEDGRMRPLPEVRGLLEATVGQVPIDRTVVHCGSGVTACHTLLCLEATGMGQAALYVGSYSEWCRR